MFMKADQSTLLLIDVQERLMPAITQGAEVAERCVTLATVAGLLGVPVIATEQLPEKLGPNLERVKELCQTTLPKTHFDACPDGLIEELPEGRQHIVIGGCESHVCMLQTALSLLDAGYKVWVVADATGSRNEFDRDVALDRLHQSGARIVTTEMVAFEWMVHCKHPHFRDVQALIK
ncbi:isochorismatase family protein [Marinobacter daepoensis]|uniref:Isochorismatase family protein n=1 Tax=Marinobacter daepoensis TaxID=262077 RepID=A0ABS3BBJ9_9GAMM|nr:isochorismatase family protein [Marinobacter daepoensis]MBN7769193.1 isochorismatase family protein [Marinobacter daepoensis]MBY6032145.1 isochorismatase family protein [Marinobacter daepoensis]MBY6077883.1 isochorismatase family protein [Marinobacter daepoensis]